MTTPAVIGGDDIVTALEAQLRDRIPVVVALLGLQDKLGEVRTWQVVPDADAIAAAALPAIAIVAPRMVSEPRRAPNEYSGLWSLSVGVFARGKDHLDTQTTIQSWAKVIRTAAVLSPNLPGTPIRIRWVAEEYALVPNKEQARTFAGAEVMFDASVDTALDLDGIRNALAASPSVATVHPDIVPTTESHI